MVGNHVMVLAEIERRLTGESFRLALALLPEGPSDKFVRSLLGLAVKTKGSWSLGSEEAKTLTDLQSQKNKNSCQDKIPAILPSSIALKTWKHQYAREESVTDIIIDCKILAKFILASTE